MFKIMIDTISNVIRAIAAWLDWQNKKQTQLNTEKIQKNASAQTDNKVKEAAEKAVEKAEKAEKGDLDELRKMASE